MSKIIEELQQDRKMIFSLIQKKGPLTKRAIQNLTNIKLTTLNRIISDLIFKELIIEESVGESTGGRKPALYNVNSSKFYSIGIDISRTYTQIVLTNLKMQIIKEKRFSGEDWYSSEDLVERIVEAVKGLLYGINITSDYLLGVGVGVIGPLEREKETKTSSTNMGKSSFKSKLIKESLESRLGLPVIIDNGANCAVLGEYFYGFGKGYDNIAYFNCGMGIRTGVITSGKIIRAINDREDAFGHMVISIDGRECYCGNCGCVESYSSIYSIVKEFKSKFKKENKSCTENYLDSIDYKDVFNLANKGEPISKAVVSNSAIVFGTALTNYINLLNPQLVILSGPTIYNSDIFYKLSTEVAIKKINASNANIKFSKGGYFKEYTMAVGAAAMVIESKISLGAERRQQ
ncbi:ROK family protein [Clostridium sp. YIM B02515]|uniref:ROK family protein n=1 Tax=Clostridium rhizosphaerae TaxID=2803861 RepID=A0ABS1TG33_9CLOT|nr:ROK family protein [Clostridium rhizosphaerae]MBL4938326.1 ROK family protein [Clostridium rhizosphaerae]